MPEGLMDDFWSDPAMVADLHLTGEQRKRLQMHRSHRKLALIDSGADALKGFVWLSSILDAEPFDDAAMRTAERTSHAAVRLSERRRDGGHPRRVLSPSNSPSCVLCARRSWRQRQQAGPACQSLAIPENPPPSLTQPIPR